MNLCNINHSFNYELEKLCRIFFPFEKINILNNEEASDFYAVSKLCGNVAYAKLYINGAVYEHRSVCISEAQKDVELGVATALFNCFVEATDYRPEWGLLTGVRPVKLYMRMLETVGFEKTERYFKERLFVSDEKLTLCRETAEPEHKITSDNSRASFSLYVSVPFCPSRCSYCSFVSHSVDKAGKLIDDYVSLLCEELKSDAEIVEMLSLKPRTIYIGGGTPVALSAEQLDTVMSVIKANFKLDDLCEYTVEAGRPDAITEAKLQAIKNGGATRISVNPQTMNDEVLSVIGRKHTAEQTIDAFNAARKAGFDNINMDLIAGLPTDTLNSFKSTLDTLLKLDPESITVHALSIKRAANIATSNLKIEAEAGKIAADMVRYANTTLKAAGILPYYMYRQSKTLGNLENVGYAKKGYEGLYNVYIMDETHTILACGASAVTKLREPGGNCIERIFNFKYPYEYISRFSEMLDRKKGIERFYGQYPI